MVIGILIGHGDDMEVVIWRRQIVVGQHGSMLRHKLIKIFSSQDQHVNTDEQSAR